jgi:hypothetical protein
MATGMFGPVGVLRAAAALTLTLVASLALGGCGQERYEYAEKQIATSQPPAPSRTIEDVREAGRSSSADSRAQMGEDLPLPDGFPATLPLPSDAWSATVVVAQPGWFDVSLVLTDPPGPMAQLLRSNLDEAYRSFVDAGVPVSRTRATDPTTGVERDVVDAELDGRAVQIALPEDGHHLSYAVENAR